jgi:signal peptidase II
MAFFFLGFLILFLDQFIKNFLIARPHFADSLQWNFLRISLVINTGTVFGLFRDNNIFFLTTAIITIALISILLLVIKKKTFLFKLALTLVLAGALSNLIDRIRLSGVIDYIDLGFWPVFNLADSSITFGIGLLILLLLKKKG